MHPCIQVTGADLTLKKILFLRAHFRALLVVRVACCTHQVEGVSVGVLGAGLGTINNITGRNSSKYQHSRKGTRSC